MGIDLSLMPMDALHRPDPLDHERTWYSPPKRGSNNKLWWGFSHTLLELPRHYEMYDAIRERCAVRLVPAERSITCFRARIPDGSWKDEAGYGMLPIEDPYGDPFTWAPAGGLAEVLTAFCPTAPTTAYVKALDPETLIILYWH